MDAVVAAAPHWDWRQLAIMDGQGRTAFFSGVRVKPEKNEAHGRDCVVLGNIVRSTKVPAAMVRAFEADATAPLALRLVAALQSATTLAGSSGRSSRRRFSSPTANPSR